MAHKNKLILVEIEKVDLMMRLWFPWAHEYHMNLILRIDMVCITRHI